ncbi:hypothetical protein ACIP4Q_28385 [Streptomyces massasporeus]
MADPDAVRKDGRRRVLVATGTLSGLERAESRRRLAESVRLVNTLMKQRFGYESAAGFGLDLTASQYRERLRTLCQGLDAADLLVLYHTGHADLAGAQHRLWMADSLDRYTNTVPTDELTSLILADTPVCQSLIVLDTCHAGHGGAEALVAGMRSLSDPAGTGESGKSISLVAAAHPREQIRPGTFARLLERAVAHPSTAGHEPPYLPPAALVSAIDTDSERPKWQTVSYSALFQTGPEAPPFFPNPRYDQRLHGLDLATQLRLEQREHYDRAVHGHFLPRAKGTDVPGEKAWRFVGRHAALEELTGWLTAAAEGEDAVPPLRVLTGDPGSGKSAVLARLVLLADPDRRSSVPRADLPTAVIPPVGCIDVTIHARGLTHEQILNALASHIGGPVSSAGRLAAQLGERRMVAVIDALDEALDPDAVIDHVIRPLAESGCQLRFLVGTRTHLLPALGTTAVTLNLDGPDYADPASLRAYVERCLQETDDESPYPAADPAMTKAVADAVAAAASRSFLVALIVARTLASQPTLPADPLDPQWRAGLPKTAAEAMRQDLDIRLGSRAQQARDLLMPLAFALGSGLPWEDIWAPLACRITGRDYTDDDLIELRRTAGAYIVEDRYHGHSVYRLYHEALAEALREERTAGEVHGAVTDFLTRHTPRFPQGTTDWSRAHPYSVAYLASHAARSGTDALDTLLLDPVFLLAAAPPAVLAELRNATSAEARAAAAVYRRTANRLQGSPAGEALSYLGHMARRLGARGLAERTEHTPLTQVWRTLWAQALPEAPHRVLDHVEPVKKVICLRTGRSRPVVVAAGGSGTVFAWDLTDGRRIGPVVQCGAGPAAGAVTPDGKPAVLVAEDKVLRAWDLTTGEPLGRPMKGHSSVITAATASLSGDGRLIAVTGSKEGEVCIWDVGNGRLLIKREEHLGTVRVAACATLHDGSLIGLTGGLDRFIRVWDLTSHRLLDGELGDHDSPVTAIATVQKPDGQPLVLSGDQRGTLRLWDLMGRRLLWRCEEMEGEIRSVACEVMPDGSLSVLSTAADDSVRLRRLSLDGSSEQQAVTGTLPGSWGDGVALLRGHVGAVTSVGTASLADGPAAVSAGTDRAVRIWDLMDGVGTRLGRDAPGAVHALVDARSARRENAVLVIGASGHQFRDASTGELLHAFSEPVAGLVIGGGPIRVRKLTDDERETPQTLLMTRKERLAWVQESAEHLIQVDSDRLGQEPWVDRIKNFRGGRQELVGRVLEGGQPLIPYITTQRKLDVSCPGARQLKFANGRALRLLDHTADHSGDDIDAVYLVGAGSATVYVWTVRPDDDVHSLQIRRTGRLRGHRGGVCALHCTTVPDLGPIVATGSNRGEVRVWQLATSLRVGRAWRVCEGPVQAVTVFRPAPGGPLLLATAGEGSRLRLWRMPLTTRSGRYHPPLRDRELLEINLEYDINCLLAADHRLLVGTKDGLAALDFSLTVDSEWRTDGARPLNA